MLDVATDKLLDFEDSVKVVVERNWNFEDNQLDNRPSETNNNLSWVRLWVSPEDFVVPTDCIDDREHGAHEN